MVKIAPNQAMKTCCLRRNFRAVLIAVLAGLLIAPVARPVNAADSYIEGLEAEADGASVDGLSAVDPEPPPPDESAKWHHQSQGLGGLLPGLGAAEFEASLRRNYYGSYMFYSRLDPMSKKLVYETYTQEPNIEVVRQKILSLLSNQTQ